MSNQTMNQIDGRVSRAAFQRFLETGGYCTPPGRAACALQSARTLAQWETLAEAGLVRLRAEPEQDSYFGVYGVPDNERERRQIEAAIERDGCWCVISEYLDDGGQWQSADAIGMCIYANPLCPFQNDNVTGLMASAIEMVGQPGEH